MSMLLMLATQTSFASSLTVSNPQISTEVSGEFSKMYATPLVVAISKGDVEVAKKFIDYGADVNETTHGKTPLMYAARGNQLEIVKYLVEKGADLSVKDKYGMTALDYAELSKATDVVTYLKSLKS